MESENAMGIQTSLFWRQFEDVPGWGPLVGVRNSHSSKLSTLDLSWLVRHVAAGQASTRIGARGPLVTRAGPSRGCDPDSRVTRVLVRPPAFLLPGCPSTFVKARAATTHQGQQQ